MADTQQRQPVVAFILAGGMGSRFGGDSPKQLARLAGHSVLHHTLTKFEVCDAVDEIVVAGNPQWCDEIGRTCERAVHNKKWVLVDGGVDRNESVGNAIAAVAHEEARVLIHDSVRPLVSSSLITRVAEQLAHSRSVLPVIPAVDPLVTVAEGRVLYFADRRQSARGQSPQGFWLSDLSAVLNRADIDKAAYSTVYELLSGHLEDFVIVTVPGELNNLKITAPVDHLLAGRLLLEED